MTSNTAPNRSVFGRWGRLLPASLAVVVLGIGIGAAPAIATSTTSPLAGTVWLCRPGAVTNPCNQDLSGNPQRGGTAFTQRYIGSGADTTLAATVFPAAGAPSVETFPAPKSPGVDCFFVYPTVDLLPNPLLQIGSLPPTANIFRWCYPGFRSGTSPLDSSDIRRL